MQLLPVKHSLQKRFSNHGPGNRIQRHGNLAEQADQRGQEARFFGKARFEGDFEADPSQLGP